LTASLHTLEQDLLHGLRSHLRQVLPERRPSLPELVQDYVTAGVTRWQTQAARRWQERIAEIGADAQALLESADWSSINEVDAEEYGRSVIVEAFRDIIDQVREHTRQTVRPLRAQSADALRSLEGAFDRAIEEARRAPQEAQSPEADRQALEAYRRRVLALAV